MIVYYRTYGDCHINSHCKLYLNSKSFYQFRLYTITFCKIKKCHLSFILRISFVIHELQNAFQSVLEIIPAATPDKFGIVVGKYHPNPACKDSEKIMKALQKLVRLLDLSRSVKLIPVRMLKYRKTILQYA